MAIQITPTVDAEAVYNLWPENLHRDEGWRVVEDTGAKGPAAFIVTDPSNPSSPPAMYLFYTTSNAINFDTTSNNEYYSITSLPNTPDGFGYMNTQSTGPHNAGEAWGESFSPVGLHDEVRLYNQYKYELVYSTIPIYIDQDQKYDPEPALGFFFTKSGFTLNFGTYVGSRNAPFYSPYDSEADEIVCYYGTGKYQPVIRFTPRDGTEHSVNSLNLTELYHPRYSYTIEEVGNTESTLKFNYEMPTMVSDGKGNSNSYIQGVRTPVGVYSKAQVLEGDTLIGYDSMVDVRSVNQFTLADLLNYFSPTEPNFDSNDLYTEIFIDFINKDTGILAKTLSLDFSSLYDSGVDVRSGGTGNEPGSSWDPLPGSELDAEISIYNPPPTNDIPLNRPTLSPFGLFNRTYALNSANMSALGDILSSNDDDVYDAILEGLKMMGANPMNAIIDLRLYPFDVKELLGSNNYEEIILGRYKTGVHGYTIDTASTAILDLGSYYVQPYFKSFLDYEPYTLINLYIPYVGTISLLPSVYMDRKITVKLIIDFITGAATAVIFANGIPMTYHQGLIGTSISVTGDNASAYANSIIGNIVGAVGSGVQAASEGSVGQVGRAVGSTVSAVTSLYDAANSIENVNFQQAGSASPLCANWLPQKCHISIARPRVPFNTLADIREYGKTIGYVTAYTATLNELYSLNDSGIFYGTLKRHEGSSANEPNPTDKEVELIKAALNDGFFTGGLTG